MTGACLARYGGAMTDPTSLPNFQPHVPSGPPNGAAKSEPVREKEFKNEVPVAAAERGDADPWTRWGLGTSLIGARG